MYNTAGGAVVSEVISRNASGSPSNDDAARVDWRVARTIIPETNLDGHTAAFVWAFGPCFLLARLGRLDDGVSSFDRVDLPVLLYLMNRVHRFLRRSNSSQSRLHSYLLVRVQTASLRIIILSVTITSRIRPAISNTQNAIESRRIRHQYLCRVSLMTEGGLISSTTFVHTDV